MKEVWFSKQGDVEQRVLVDRLGVYYKQIRFSSTDEWVTTYESTRGFEAVISH